MTSFLAALEERFLRYVQIDTESDEASASVPSTAKQYDLLNPLKAELEALGVPEVAINAQGFVIGRIPASPGHESAPSVAFLAHVDTTQAFSGTGVKPIVHRKYGGEPIALPDDPSQVLRPEEIPYLAQKAGDDIVTASGTTLLGADDKAGVAIIVTMAEQLLAHPEIAHGPVVVCFTIDEEIGTGINHLDIAELGADYAYTLDGGPLGELTYESFSADKALVKITGVSTHPGTAFGELVNALTLAAKIVAALPQGTRTPETTRDREGFVHLTGMHGSPAQAELSFILRDFEREGLKAHGELLQAVAAAVQAGEPRAKISVAITPQYRNMRYWLEDDMRPVDVAAAAMRKLGIEPISSPIRGGTDGSKLTERGLLTPNLFAGMQNIHGPLEWVSLNDMARAVEVCVEIARGWAG